MCRLYSEDQRIGEGKLNGKRMRKIKLKICGVRHPGNAGAVLDIDPDYLGFIFYKKSPRYVGNDYHWIGNFETGPKVGKVGVFVDEPAGNILRISGEVGLDGVQLHGDEKPETCRRLKEGGLQVIKVFSMGSDFSFSALDAYIQDVDFFLFDTKGKYLGGNGIPFDWSLLEHYPRQVPFFLSGGIGTDNIGHVKFLKHPMLYAVDVNSKLESRPGIKDARLLKQFEGEFEKLNHDQ
jgi:phosphoribosylanthranilate isomerase